MHNSQKLWRTLSVLLLTAALCGSFAFPEGNRPAKAAPQQAVLAPHLVISEFRTRGPAGTDDEFVEIYNPTGATVTLSNWSLQKSNACDSGTDTLAKSINTTLGPGQYYLFGRVNTATPPGQLYSGPTPDATFSKLIADEGGIALVDNLGNIVDAVGMCNDTAFKEGNPLVSLTLNNEQSYERTSGAGNCGDTNNNLADFLLNASSSNPQTSSSTPVVCLAVKNVTSTANGVYKSGDPPIDITVTFTNQVDVNAASGTPNLALETGVNHTSAIYVGGSGTDTLTFRYTIQAGDTSGDLDYVATDSLALNGATITGAMGDANLALPIPSSPGSLSANKDIVIDDGIAPSLVSIQRRNPASDSTNADSLTFRVTFSEAVINVDASDFKVNSNPVLPSTSPITAGITNVTPVGSGDIYDLTVSGGDLANFNGTVGLDINSALNNITDKSVPVGKPLPNVEPPADLDEVYTVDNTAPTVTIEQADGQLDPASATPVDFTVAFSEPIDATTFTVSDITQSIAPPQGASFITWNIKDSGNHQNFTVSAVSVGQNGNLVPTIAADKVKDLAGNNNIVNPSKDNSVTFLDNVRPTVTVNQVSTQADPTNTFPILFSVAFSEPINVSSFKVADITQGGTATGVTWSINDSGDHIKFTLSATAATAAGTIVPSIAANKVMDVIGNSNVASTGSDNSVTYTTTAPSAYHSVIINEIAWSGTKANADDEWIELYNTTNSTIDLNDWELKSDDGSPTISLAGLKIAGNSYLLLARNADTFKDVTPDLIYGKQTSNQGLLNGGEILRLRIKASNTLIDVANSYTGYGFAKWAAGTASPNFASMERTAYLFSHPSEWVTYGGNGNPDVHDRANNLVFGTPGDPNWINAAARSITTIISDTPDPSLVNGLVTVTVTVVGGVSVPTGTVSITGANTNCTITLSSGIGSCATVKFTSAGSKTITATYNADANHPSSTDTETHQVSTSLVTTPTRVPTALPPPPLLAINEFVPRPGHDWNNDGIVNTGDEYIEVLNHGVVNVNLSGYSLDDEVNVGSAPYRLPALTLRPGERYVFYGSETGLLLGDGGDGVRLLKPNGQLADAYNYTVVERPDQSFCRLPDNGGADDWNQNCYPTPGLQNSLNQGESITSNSPEKELYCPIADTLPDAFAEAECEPFGNNIWRPEYWDRTGWYGDQNLPGIQLKWPVFAN